MTAGLPVPALAGWLAAGIGARGQATREQLARCQLERLNATIARAQSVSPFYRRRLADFAPKQLTR
jgi:phenylacetate-coenzyme A ligase PaaK-like adenylate-forming protein